MDAKRMLNRGFRWLSFAALAALAGATVVGCDESSAQAEPSAEPAAPAAEAVAPAPAELAPAPAEVAGKSSYKEEAFHLSISAPDGVKAGKPTKLTVVLEAQSGFKVNDEYPLKFQFAEVAGVSPAKDTVRKDDAKVEKKKAEIPLTVTIKSAGKHQVSGKLSFSVCTDERCLIEKRDLTLSVDAS